MPNLELTFTPSLQCAHSNEANINSKQYKYNYKFCNKIDKNLVKYYLFNIIDYIFLQ